MGKTQQLLIDLKNYVCLYDLDYQFTLYTPPKAGFFIAYFLNVFRSAYVCSIVLVYKIIGFLTVS